MTEITSIFDVSVAHGESAKQKATYSRKLDRTLLQRNGFRVISSVEQKDGPYFCAADFGSESRGNANIVSCGLLVFDIDQSTVEDVRRSISLLKSDLIEFVCYTTARHNPTGDEPRVGYRLILRPERPLNLSEYRMANDYVNRKYEMNAAVESRVPSQAMFYPTVIDEYKEHLKCVHFTGTDSQVAGPVIIPAEVLDAAAKEHDIVSGSTSPPVVMPAGVDEATYLSTLLSLIDPTTLTYHEWLDVSMALHHQTFGKGMELWNAWSARDKSDRYNPEEMQSKWESFTDDPAIKGKTLRSILNQEVARGITNETRLIGKLMKEVESGNQLENYRAYVVEQSENGFLKGVNTHIAESYIKAKKRLFDIKITSGQAVHELRSKEVSDEKREYFYNNFVYLTSENNYYELATGIERTCANMDVIYTRDYGTPDPKGVCKPITQVLSRENIYTAPRYANDYVYEPMSDGQVVEKVDGYYINRFNHSEWRKPMSEFDPTNDRVDAMISGKVNIHMDVLSDGRPEVKTFLMQYLAHLRQRPGTRIHHAICITSAAYGIGKSVTQALYKSVLGESNIGALGKADLSQTFDSYLAAPKLVQFIDEFDELTRKRSTELLTKMKSAITEDMGPVSFKGQDQRTMPYYCSYILFSNERDVLGNDSGRRWSHFDIQKVTLGQNSQADQSLEDILGVERGVFYGEYVKLMATYPERFAAMFDTIDLTGFDTDGPLILKRENDVVYEGDATYIVSMTLNEMIEDNHQFVREDVIKVSSLLERCQSNYALTNGEEFRSPVAMRKVIKNHLINHGYQPVKGRRKIPGMGAMHAHRSEAVFTKGNQTDIIAAYQEYVEDDSD